MKNRTSYLSFLAEVRMLILDEIGGRPDLIDHRHETAAPALEFIADRRRPGKLTKIKPFQWFLYFFINLINTSIVKLVLKFAVKCNYGFAEFFFACGPIFSMTWLMEWVQSELRIQKSEFIFSFFKKFFKTIFFKNFFFSFKSFEASGERDKFLPCFNRSNSNQASL